MLIEFNHGCFFCEKAGDYMAATRLIVLHENKGKTILQALKDRIDYAQNPEKTEKGELISAYECDPKTAAEEFLLSKRNYEQKTGKRNSVSFRLFWI